MRYVLLALVRGTFDESTRKLEELLELANPGPNYALLAGDEAGIRFAIEFGAQKPASKMCSPYLLFSSTKLTTAAAIGAAVAQGQLGWKDGLWERISDADE